MYEELQQAVNEAKAFSQIKISGEVCLEIPKSKSFYVGKSFSKNLIQITKPNLTIDGEGGVLRLNVTEPLDYDTNVLFLSGLAKNVEIKNLKLYVYVGSPACAHRVTGIYNTAYGLKLTNCHIEIVADEHVSLTGIFNNGNIDTHMETRADNLSVQNCTIKTRVAGGEIAPCETYGIYNHLANSISVQNSFVYAENKGDGEEEKAVGVYTNGRFGRFVGNNIKANGGHNLGKEREQAHAYGFINEGLYSLMSANNIVGEWGGLCVGLENKGNFANVSGNKILATHTICGRTVRNDGDDCIFDGNICTSTSRNARIFEAGGANCILSANVLEGLVMPQDFISGCGIYAKKSAEGNIIRGNIIKNVSDCGIFEEKDAGEIKDNLAVTYRECTQFRERSDVSNEALARKFDERNIRSLQE